MPKVVMTTVAPHVSAAARDPRPELAPYVRALHGASSVGGPPARQLELPVAGTAVIVALDHCWRIAPEEHAPLRVQTSFAGGLSLAPAVSQHDGAYAVVEVVLSPLGTAALLGVAPAELAGEVVALDALLGPEAGLLAEQLACLPDWGTRLSALEAWITRRVIRRPAPLPPDVSWALKRFDDTGGRMAVGTLQTELGCSRRHLSARFAGSVGTTPKAYAQLVRFGRAADRLRRGGTPAEVAAACGYADQAHLTREVRRFGATTPAQLRRPGPAAVTIVQDAEPSLA